MMGSMAWDTSSTAPGQVWRVPAVSPSPKLLLLALLFWHQGYRLDTLTTPPKSLPCPRAPQCPQLRAKGNFFLWLGGHNL